MTNTTCISIEALFNKYSNNLPSGNYIEVSYGEDMCYYDLRDKHSNLVCMDGEECEIAYAGYGYYALTNKEGEIDTTFILTMEEVGKAVGTNWAKYVF